MIISADSDAPGSTLARAIDGDQDAFMDLVAEYDGRLVRACFVICGDADLAREAAQLAWVKAWRNLGRLRDETRLPGWLMVIAMNEARQLIRSQRRRHQREQRAATLGHPSSAIPPDYADLSEALEKLDGKDQAILLMRYVENMTSESIGGTLGMSPNTVRTRLRRLLQRLRKELNHA